MSAPWRLNSCSSSAMTSYSMRPGPAEAHGAHVRAGGDLARPAHQADLRAALEQAHVVQHVIERHELLRRVQCRCAPARAVQLTQPTTRWSNSGFRPMRVEDALAALQQPGQDLVDVGDREGVIGAVVAPPRRSGPPACRPRSRARRVALAHEQHVLRRPRGRVSAPPRHSGSAEAGEVDRSRCPGR